MEKIVQFQMGLTGVEVREGSISIEGYASTPSIDRYNSIIEVDAIKNGLSNYEKNPVLLLGHDSSKPIGTVTDWEIDKKGWKVKAEITRNTDGVMEDVNEGRTKGFSIGFIPLAWRYMDRASGKDLTEMTQEEQSSLDYQDIVRVITAVDIVELSVVNVPANPQSLFTISKALRAFFAEVETRQVAERYLVKDNENPFVTPKAEPIAEETEEKTPKIDKNTEETAETTEQEENKEDAEEETIIDAVDTDNEPKNDEKIEETEEIETPIEELKETVEETDIATSEAQDEEGSDGETPDTVQDAETQTDAETVEELQMKLEEERKLNDEVIADLSKRVESLKAIVDSRAVNKPLLHTNTRVEQKQVDPFINMLKQKKNGL